MASNKDKYIKKDNEIYRIRIAKDYMNIKENSKNTFYSLKNKVDNLSVLSANNCVNSFKSSNIREKNKNYDDVKRITQFSDISSNSENQKLNRCDFNYLRDSDHFFDIKIKNDIKNMSSESKDQTGSKICSNAIFKVSNDNDMAEDRKMKVNDYLTTNIADLQFLHIKNRECFENQQYSMNIDQIILNNIILKMENEVYFKNKNKNMQENSNPFQFRCCKTNFTEFFEFSEHIEKYHPNEFNKSSSSHGKHKREKMFMNDKDKSFLFKDEFENFEMTNIEKINIENKSFDDQKNICEDDKMAADLIVNMQNDFNIKYKPLEYSYPENNIISKNCNNSVIRDNKNFSEQKNSMTCQNESYKNLKNIKNDSVEDKYNKNNLNMRNYKEIENNKLRRNPYMYRNFYNGNMNENQRRIPLEYYYNGNPEDYRNINKTPMYYNNNFNNVNPNDYLYFQNNITRSPNLNVSDPLSKAIKYNNSPLKKNIMEQEKSDEKENCNDENTPTKKKFCCEKINCQRGFTSKAGLTYHIEHGHTKQHDVIKPFVCTVKGCEKKYKNSNGLKYHMDHAHQY